MQPLVVPGKSGHLVDAVVLLDRNSYYAGPTNLRKTVSPSALSRMRFGIRFPLVNCEKAMGISNGSTAENHLREVTSATVAPSNFWPTGEA
jgi:hypothetical protein